MKSAALVLQSSLSDSSFAKVKAEDCELFMEIDVDHLQFAVFNHESEQFVALRSYHVNAPFHVHETEMLTRFWEVDEWIKLPFRSQKISLAFLPYSIIPAAHYQFNPLSEWQLTNHVSSPDAILSFEVNAQLQTWIQQHFNNYSLYHNITPLLEASSKESILSHEQSLLMNIHAHHIDILAYKDNVLQLCNTYKYATPEDIIYFLTFICNQFQMSHEEVKIFLAGEITRQSAIYLNLSKYFRNIDFMKRPLPVHFFSLALSTPSQFYYNLFTLKNVL